MILVSTWIGRCIHPSIHLPIWRKRVLQIFQKRYCCRTHITLTLGTAIFLCFPNEFSPSVLQPITDKLRAFDGTAYTHTRKPNRGAINGEKALFNKRSCTLYDDDFTVNVSLTIHSFSHLHSICPFDDMINYEIISLLNCLIRTTVTHIVCTQQRYT